MQWTIAAHACAVGASGWTVAADVQAAVVANDGMAMPDCDDAGMKAAVDGKICASHCQADSQVDVDSITPVPPIAPQPALTISVAVPSVLCRSIAASRAVCALLSILSAAL
jgi:hypothetical protein